MAGPDRQPVTSNLQCETRDSKRATRTEPYCFNGGQRPILRGVSMRAFFAFCTRCSAILVSADYILKHHAAVFKGLIILPFDYSKVLDKKNVG